MIKKNNLNFIIIHTQLDTDPKYFNLSSIDSYYNFNVELGIKCNNLPIIIGSIVKNIIYIDKNLSDEEIESIHLVYNSINLQKEKIIEKSEKEYFNKSKVICVNKNLKKNSIIKINDLDLINVENSDRCIKSMFIDTIIGKKLLIDIKENEILLPEHFFDNYNYVIGDSLLNRGDIKLDYIIPWIGYSNVFPHYNNKYDTYPHRNSGYLVNLKLNSKYSNIIIQLGINDCSPRKIKYKLINKNDPNIGFLFDRIIPDKEFLNFINFNSNNIEEYIEYSSKNSEFIQKKYYEFYGKHNQCIDKITFQNNIELFYKNNQHLFDNVYFVSIIKCNSFLNKNFKSNEIIDEYNNILKNLESKFNKFKYIDLYKNNKDIFNIITSNIRNDNWLENKDFKEDGYHINNKKYIYLSNVLDKNIIN